MTIEGFIEGFILDVSDNESKIENIEKEAENIKKLKEKYKVGLVITTKKIGEAQEFIGKKGIANYFDSIIIDTVKGIGHYKKCCLEMQTKIEKVLIIRPEQLGELVEYVNMPNLISNE
ncbi:MAG: hypothetical protein QXJ92_00120 [Candidatus Pacearchaeota archaeon]